MTKDICTLLNNALKDESNAFKFYGKVENKIDKANRWIIDEIRLDEKDHHQKLTQLVQRLHCGTKT